MAKSLLEYIRSKKLDDYGSMIPVEDVQRFLGIDPDPDRLMTVAEFNSASLSELAATNSVREALLKEGKYLTKDGSTYRILLPSENAAKAAMLIESGKRKYSKASTLLKNTAKEHSVDQSSAKLNLLANAIDSMKNRLALLS